MLLRVHHLLVLIILLDLAFTSVVAKQHPSQVTTLEELDPKYYMRVLQHERQNYDMAKLIMREERTLSLRQNAYHKRIKGQYLKHFENDV